MFIRRGTVYWWIDTEASTDPTVQRSRGVRDGGERQEPRDCVYRSRSLPHLGPVQSFLQPRDCQVCLPCELS